MEDSPYDVDPRSGLATLPYTMCKCFLCTGQWNGCTWCLPYPFYFLLRSLISQCFAPFWGSMMPLLVPWLLGPRTQRAPLPCQCDSIIFHPSPYWALEQDWTVETLKRKPCEGVQEGRGFSVPRKTFALGLLLFSVRRHSLHHLQILEILC